MIALSTIRVLWRQPDLLTLWGVPYDMREGQQPGDLWRAREAYKATAPGHYGSPRVNLDDWICLGQPGWWGAMSREDQDAVKAWLVGRDVPNGPGEWCRIEGQVKTMKTTDWIATMPEKCRVEFQLWADDMWNRGGRHGLVLAEALFAAAPGKIDGMDSADRLLKCMEAERWIECGKLELHTAARRISAGNKGSNARPLDYFWMPRRTSIEFRAYLYPSPPEKPKGPMIQLPLFAEVTP